MTCPRLPCRVLPCRTACPQTAAQLPLPDSLPAPGVVVCGSSRSRVVLRGLSGGVCGVRARACAWHRGMGPCGESLSSARCGCSLDVDLDLIVYKKPARRGGGFLEGFVQSARTPESPLRAAARGALARSRGVYPPAHGLRPPPLPHSLCPVFSFIDTGSPKQGPQKQAAGVKSRRIHSACNCDLPYSKDITRPGWTSRQCS